MAGNPLDEEGALIHQIVNHKRAFLQWSRGDAALQWSQRHAATSASPSASASSSSSSQPLVLAAPAVSKSGPCDQQTAAPARKMLPAKVKPSGPVKAPPLQKGMRGRDFPKPPPAGTNSKAKSAPAPETNPPKPSWVKNTEERRRRTES